MNNHILIGKIIKEIFLDDHGHAIKFVLDDGAIIIAYWDSATWIEDIFYPNTALDFPIQDVFDLELPGNLQNSKTKKCTENCEDCMNCYGLVIKTAKGQFTIAHRTSSNEFYGPNLNFTAYDDWRDNTNSKNWHWQLLPEN